MKGIVLNKEKVFILASCMELALGLLKMCHYEISIKRFVLWGFFAVYFMVACTNHYSQKEKAVLMVSMLMGILLYVNSGINTGIKAPIYIMALKKIDIRKLLKWMIVTMCVMIAGIAMASLLFGFGNLYIDDFRKEGFFHGIRYSLGFGHPNMLQFVVFSIFGYWLYIYGAEMSLRQYIFLGIGYLVFEVLTYSKTGFILGGIIWCGALVLRWNSWKYWGRVLAGVYVTVVLLFVSISLAAAAGIHGDVMEIIDNMITGRMNQLSYATIDKQYLLPYMNNWRLFSPTTHRNVYDLGYVQIFYYYGIIPAVCYLMFLLYAVYQSVQQKNTYGCLILLGFSMYLFTESLYFSNYLTQDFLLISAAICVWGINHDKETKMVSWNF